MYTWELDNWPAYSFDQKSAELWTSQALAASQKILGAIAVVPESLGSEAKLDLLVSAAIETSAIEGESLSREDVRSSIKNHFLGPKEKVAVHDPVAAGISALILEVMDLYEEKLTVERLHHWNKLVIPEQNSGSSLTTAGRAGQWRTHSDAMQIVSGPVHNPTIHFEAPPSARVPAEMQRFLDWFDKDSRGVPGVTPWVDWFGERIVEALNGAIDVIQYVVTKARFWDELDTDVLNTRQIKLIRRMLGQDAPSFENGINASKYQNLTRCSKATATRDLQGLVAQGILAPIHSKGRYARYKLSAAF